MTGRALFQGGSPGLVAVCALEAASTEQAPAFDGLATTKKTDRDDFCGIGRGMV
jgi:hypothetical protein